MGENWRTNEPLIITPADIERAKSEFVSVMRKEWGVEAAFCVAMDSLYKNQQYQTNGLAPNTPTE